MLLVVDAGDAPPIERDARRRIGVVVVRTSPKQISDLAADAYHYSHIATRIKRLNRINVYRTYAYGVQYITTIDPYTAVRPY